MRPLLEEMLRAAAIPAKKLPAGTELHTRRKQNKTYDFYLNSTPDPVRIDDISGTDLLTGQSLTGTATIPRLGALVSQRF